VGTAGGGLIASGQETARLQQSMGALLARSYASHVTSTAVIEAGETTSFAQLQERVHRFGNALSGLGLRRGDRVVIWLENCPEFVEIEQATFLFGFVRTALAARLHVDEVVGIVQDCRPKVVIATAGTAATLSTRLVGGEAPVVIAVPETVHDGVRSYRDLRESAPSTPPVSLPSGEDLAALLYTSGTTGRPKGAAIRHRNWVAMVSGLLAELPPIDRDDLVLHSAPMSHLSGSIGTACYVRGAATAMLARFQPALVLRTVQDLGVTVLPLVPTMLAALTTEAERGSFDLSTLRAVPYGGSAVSPSLLSRAQDVFGDVLVQLYGLSEALVPLSALSPSAHARHPTEPQARHLASAGRPTPFVDMRIITENGVEALSGETGEIQVRSDTVMAGYWGQPDATAEVIGDHGWLHTGDIGFRDDGYLYIVDRKRDVIVSGGFNIYPAEVERVIEDLPQVDEVVVVGAPHERWGETVTAVVTRKDGQHLTERDIIDACRSRLADYKKPTSVLFVEELPKNSSGKLLRRQVRARFWAERDRPIGA
jgi:long-chain acyl-CoA synthetase